MSGRVDAELRSLAAGVLLPGFAGTTAPEWVLRWIADGGLAGVLLFGRNVVDDDQVAALSARLAAERGDAVVAIDEEGGDVTRLDAGRGSEIPGNYALGVAGDPQLTDQVATALGRRLVACGITANFAPSADLTLTELDPIIGVRSFGSDPRRAAQQIEAFVRGLQRCGVAACAKHFPGHGAATEDSHATLPVLSRGEQTLREVELVPFAAAIAAGVRSVMLGHLVIPAWGQEPASLSPKAVSVLREELGFTGTVVTDAIDMGAVTGTAGMAGGAIAALKAGADTLVIGGTYTDEGTVEKLVDALVEAVVTDVLPLDRLYEAANRTRELGGPAGTDGGSTDWDHSIGLVAARRAIVVRGEAKLTVPPLVVELTVAPTIAVGEVPWSFGDQLIALVPDTEILRLSTADASVARIVAAASGRPVVVVTRDAPRYPWVVDLLGELVDSGLDLIRVETGVPGPTLGVAAVVDTHGAARVCLRAGAELLAGTLGG
ncbi:MAG TPA: glycoside hydrolase family 3 N-terminal domain-containing protein [Pseudonocardiaceae bacterium]|nr:glycoside hydrolase family 3 N-terminal domain-containing protein [Pseudonocardiaceae bacterium]